MLRNILFDFDGTLVDTNDLIITALNESSRHFLGRDLTQEDLNSILGKYLDDQMKYLSPEYYKEMVLFYKTYYKEHQFAMIKEFPGIRQMLSDLKELGCKIAIVSAKGRGGIEQGLSHFGLADFIDVIISAYDIQNNKPHPEPALKAMKALGAAACETILVGDSPYDILCGKNAEIKTALVDWTIFPKDDLLNLKPDYVLMSASDLVNIVKSSI